MSEEHDRKVRRRRSRAEAEQIAAEYEASGLSRTKFCQTRGLALTTLDRYQKRRQQQGQAIAKSHWLTVKLSDPKPGPVDSAGCGLALVLAGERRIEVGRGFDASTLEQLLRVLEQA